MTPREPFAGAGPWRVNLPGLGYIETPDDDPAFLYQDTLIGLNAARGINIGQPSAHARWLGAVRLRDGETVIQVGAGSGYYTAILAYLVGRGGRVYAFEIDPDLAARAKANLEHLPQAVVAAQTGIADNLPKVDAVYVCAAITQPCSVWLEALKSAGRLVFPLHAVGGGGGMLMIRRPEHGGVWPATFISNAAFISCVGPQDEETGRRLNAAYAAGGGFTVRSFRTDLPTDDTCWFAGDGWWLSTFNPASDPDKGRPSSRP